MRPIHIEQRCPCFGGVSAAVLPNVVRSVLVYPRLIRPWSTGSGVRLQVDVDAHAGEQRRLADEINHDLKRVNVGGLARPALADAAWPQRLPERGDLAIEILAWER